MKIKIKLIEPLTIENLTKSDLKRIGFGGHFTTSNLYLFVKYFDQPSNRIKFNIYDPIDLNYKYSMYYDLIDVWNWLSQEYIGWKHRDLGIYTIDCSNCITL